MRKVAEVSAVAEVAEPITVPKKGVPSLWSDYESVTGPRVRFVRQTATAPVSIEPSATGFRVFYGDSVTECASVEIADMVASRVAEFAGGWV